MIRHEVAGTIYVEIEGRGFERHPWYRVSLKPSEQKLVDQHTESELHLMEMFADPKLAKQLKRLKNNIRVGAV